MISVVLPVRYVREDWLRQSIESVLSQDYANKELIVVNDEATQDIDALARSYGIAKYLKNGRNRGLPYSLNRGFEQAVGELHTWTSADNHMLPGMLSHLATALVSHPDAAIAFGRTRGETEDARPFDPDAADRRLERLTHVPREATTIPPRYVFMTTLGACFLYRAAVWRTLSGYDESLHGAEDYDFWVRAAEQFRIVRLPATVPPLYAYRVHADSISATVPGCFTALRARILRRELRRRGFVPGLLEAFAHIAWQGLIQSARTRWHALRSG